MTGADIYLIRVTHRMNQETLAARAGVSRSLVSQIENDYRVSDEARQKVIAVATQLQAQGTSTTRKRRQQVAA